MFRKIKEFFHTETTLETDAEGNPTTRDIQLAVGLFLLEASAADGDLGQEELAIIVRTMQRVFALDETTAVDLLDTANSFRENNDKQEELIQTVNKLCDEKQKLLILALIWKIIVADGCIKGFESGYAVNIGIRLQLSEHKIESARSLALSRKI